MHEIHGKSTAINCKTYGNKLYLRAVTIRKLMRRVIVKLSLNIIHNIHAIHDRVNRENLRKKINASNKPSRHETCKSYDK